VEPKNVIELEDVTNLEIDSLIPMRVEEETLTIAQGEVGKSSENKKKVIQTLIPKHRLNTMK